MVRKGKVLVVEDDQSIREVVYDYLMAAGYEVAIAVDGASAHRALESFQPHLLILDINLPDTSGFEIARQLKGKSDLFIIMLTAQTEEDDQIMGLRLGADDYVTKPFSPRTLVARVDAFMRRHTRQDRDSGRICGEYVCIDASSREVRVTEGPEIALTYTEFNLLHTLATHAGSVMDRERLLSLVWGDTFFGNDRVVDVYVGQVRRKLAEATGQTLIETVRGVGYKYADRIQ